MTDASYSVVAIITRALSRLRQEKDTLRASIAVRTSSMSVAGPVEGLFLAAMALSLAERMRLRWPHVEGVMSSIMVRRLGAEEELLLLWLDAMVVALIFCQVG